MHLNFILNKNTVSAVITLKITDHNNSYLIETPLRIKPEMWDQVKERPKNIYLKIYKTLNQRLDCLKVGIATYLREKKGVGTITSLSRQIKKLTLRKNNIRYKEASLLYYMDRYINSREHLIGLSTYKRYKVFLRLLERYEGHCLKELMIAEVNAEFTRNFLEFGLREEYSKSTIYRTIDFVRTILNFLEKRGIRTFAYELELPKLVKHRMDLVILNEEELKTIKETVVPDQLQPAKDWLIISCFTGQRVSDFMDFSKDKLQVIKEKKCLAFMQKKTKKNILLPLHPVVKEILKNNDCFPKKLPVQRYNLQIKQIVKLAGITGEIKVRKRRGFRVSEEMVPKWEAISSHIGRRSFASNFYGKIPTPLLMEATGHSTEEMFHRYIGTMTQRSLMLATYFENDTYALL